MFELGYSFSNWLTIEKKQLTTWRNAVSSLLTALIDSSFFLFNSSSRLLAAASFS